MPIVVIVWGISSFISLILMVAQTEWTCRKIRKSGIPIENNSFQELVVVYSICLVPIKNIYIAIKMMVVGKDVAEKMISEYKENNEDVE